MKSKNKFRNSEVQKTEVQPHPIVDELCSDEIIVSETSSTFQTYEARAYEVHCLLRILRSPGPLELELPAGDLRPDTRVEHVPSSS